MWEMISPMIKKINVFRSVDFPVDPNSGVDFIVTVGDFPVVITEFQPVIEISRIDDPGIIVDLK